MLKALLRKQMLEINKGFFYDYKKGRNRTKRNMIGFIVFYVFLMVGVLGGTFGFIGWGLAQALVPAGFGWLYFDIMLLIAIVLGVFGTVFNTYSSLYQSTDNDLLLSMPIPVKNILISRMLGVYVMDLLFSSVVLIPTLIMFYIYTPKSFATIIGPIILAILSTLFVMILSVGLGWVVAKASTKLKNKSYVSALVALLGIGLYYLVYFKATYAIQDMIQHIDQFSVDIKGALWIAYYIGSVGEGKLVPVLLMSAIIIAGSLGVLYVLNMTFIKIVTTKTGNAKIEYKEKTVKTRSIGDAILVKELQRFASSSTYMLNCGMGSVIMLLCAVMILIKGQSLVENIMASFGGIPGAMGVILAGAMVFIMSMNDTPAASISLEGKNLWIYQTLPIEPFQVLKGKLKVHLVITLVPALLLAVVLLITMQIPKAQAVLVIIFTIADCVLSGSFGLMINLLKPNMNWTNETMVVKQSFGVFIAMFSGWILGMLVIVSGLFLTRYISALLILAIWSIVTIILDILLFCWLKTKGCRILMSL